MLTWLQRVLLTLPQRLPQAIPALQLLCQPVLQLWEGEPACAMAVKRL